MNNVLKNKNGNILDPKIPRYEKEIKNINEKGLKNINDILSRIKCGTTTKHPTSQTSVQLFSVEELKSMFNVNSIAGDEIFCAVMNGDNHATGAHYDGTTWTDNGLYVTFAQSINTQIRINYFIYYFGQK